MDTFLLLILFVVIGFLSFHFINQRLQKKLLYLTGLEFLLIGILIGQPFVNFLNQSIGLQLPILLNDENSVQLRPIIAIIIGAVGFSVGLQFRIKELFNYSPEHFKLSITDVLFTMIFMCCLSFVIISKIFQSFIQLEDVIASSLIIGITSTTLSIGVLESIKSKFQAEGNNFNTLLLVPKLNNFFAISLLGLMLVLIRHGSTRGISITPIEWFVLNIALGLLMGFLFFVFLEREEDENKLLVALLGIIIFSSGSAYFLNLSPLFLNMLVGFVIGNFFKSKETLTEIFRKLEHPFYVIILIYAGAIIRIDNFLVFIFGLIMYLILRYLIKIFNGWLAFKSSFDKSKFSPLIGKGLSTQGILAIVMIVNYQQVYNNPLTNSIFAIVIFGVLINEILSTKFIKDLLIDLNEIK
jgi:Kef-type K+ transport system membrane component KefB